MIFIIIISSLPSYIGPTGGTMRTDRINYRKNLAFSTGCAKYVLASQTSASYLGANAILLHSWRRESLWIRLPRIPLFLQLIYLHLAYTSLISCLNNAYSRGLPSLLAYSGYNQQVL